MLWARRPQVSDNLLQEVEKGRKEKAKQAEVFLKECKRFPVSIFSLAEWASWVFCDRASPKLAESSTHTRGSPISGGDFRRA